VGQPAARKTDKVVGSDTHVVMVPSPPGAPVPTPLPGHVFSGQIGSKTWSDVRIEGQPAATVGSIARNSPPHVPVPPGTSFAKPPSNQGTVSRGSSSVNIHGSAAARLGDPVKTCNDPVDLDAAAITSGAKSVRIG
jgi:uncharacterized Zn-binding protein involved in type VI secretion